ncbi:hypothetical protein E5D57_008715 [Metarhizium anisopliae]|nr:hypothetical protein E5D57_008715 [Metarhizium anisopliae]
MYDLTSDNKRASKTPLPLFVNPARQSQWSHQKFVLRDSHTGLVDGDRSPAWLCEQATMQWNSGPLSTKRWRSNAGWRRKTASWQSGLSTTSRVDGCSDGFVEFDAEEKRASAPIRLSRMSILAHDGVLAADMSRNAYRLVVLLRQRQGWREFNVAIYGAWAAGLPRSYARIISRRDCA